MPGQERSAEADIDNECFESFMYIFYSLLCLVVGVSFLAFLPFGLEKSVAAGVVLIVVAMGVLSCIYMFGLGRFGGQKCCGKKPQGKNVKAEVQREDAVQLT